MIARLWLSESDSGHGHRRGDKTLPLRGGVTWVGSSVERVGRSADVATLPDQGSPAPPAGCLPQNQPQQDDCERGKHQYWRRKRAGHDTARGVVADRRIGVFAT